ncbi:MAG: thioredoxin [Anaerolineales bacterium]|nr:thioredoxin [Anaerolineales bacterium]
MGNLLEITDQNFQDKVLDADKPVLIDLWAVWCMPCRTVAPIIEQLADEYNDKLLVGKMDVDANPSTPVKYGVQGIPTCILFKGGEEVARIVGARPKSQFVSMLEPYVE